MNNVILQPCSNPIAAANYRRTVQQPVLLSTILPLLAPQDAEILQQIYPDGTCAIWGMTPGKNGKKVPKWNSMQEGDVTLFSAKNKFFVSAVVTYKVHNPAVAAQLWEPDKRLGQLFEYVYFLDELRELDIPYTPFNELLGYEPNNVVQGFDVLDAAKSKVLFDAFELASDTYVEPNNQTTYEDLQNKLDALEKTDGVRSVKYRLEQARLKKYLFGYHTIATCGICQQDFPVGILVTAHIKPRAKCEPAERKDRHVVMPMCKFGCDELFERGYISVQAGKVVELTKQPSTAAVRAKLAEVVGKTCTYATPERTGYFDWHFDSHRKKSL